MQRAGCVGARTVARRLARGSGCGAVLLRQRRTLSGSCAAHAKPGSYRYPGKYHSKNTVIEPSPAEELEETRKYLESHAVFGPLLRKIWSESYEENGDEFVSGPNPDLIRAALGGHGIFEDVFKPSKNWRPDTNLKVAFADDHRAYKGNIVPAASMVAQPRVWWDAPADSWWTLVCTNPDYPANWFRGEAELLHWAVVNIPGTDVDKGQVLAPFAPPMPFERAGICRYAWLLMRQSKGHSERLQQLAQSPHAVQPGQWTSRTAWSTQALLDQHDDLSVAGAALVRSAWDDSVAQTWKDVLGDQAPGQPVVRLAQHQAQQAEPKRHGFGSEA